MRLTVLLASVLTAALAFPMPVLGQRIQFPTTNGLRPVGSTVQTQRLSVVQPAELDQSWYR